MVFGRGLSGRVDTGGEAEENKSDTEHRMGWPDRE